MNAQGPRNLSGRRKAAVHELGWLALRRLSVYAHTGCSQACTHTSVLYRCAILVLQLLSMLTANRTVTVHPVVMTCLCFQKPPLPKWKNTLRILKHTSQNKGRKVGAEVLCTMKAREGYE